MSSLLLEGQEAFAGKNFVTFRVTWSNLLHFMCSSFLICKVEVIAGLSTVFVKWNEMRKAARILLCPQSAPSTCSYLHSMKLGRGSDYPTMFMLDASEE
jgi:hypothetical protein